MTAVGRTTGLRRPGPSTEPDPLVRSPEGPVLVVGTLPPTVGGISSVVADHVSALAARGWGVEVVNTGARLRRRPGRPSLENLFATARDVVGVVAACVRDRPSVAAVHGVGSPLLPLGRLTALVAAARLTGTRTVVHLHAYDLEHSLQDRTFRCALHLLGRLTDGLTVLHPALAGPVAIATRRPVVVLPNSVDTAHYEPGQPPAGSATTDDRPCTRMVFVGTVGHRKGIPALVEAVRRVGTPVHLTVVGGAGEEGEAVHRAVRQEARDLVDAGVVSFTGELDREAVREELQRADLFVLPSTGEGMPVALLEAMACGLPVVVSDAGAMASMVASAGAGLVVPAGDPDALVAALGRAAADPAWRRRAGRAARLHIEHTYARPAVVAELEALYRTVGETARRRS